MICQRCQRTFRNSNRGRCYYCHSKCHPKCNDVNEYIPGSGDRRHQWRCGLCQAVVEDTERDNSKENLLNIITALSDKFEVVNKIQLPKLNGELAHIKYMSDHISKQNEEILRKITDVERRNCLRTEKRTVISAPSQSYRKRRLNLTSLGNWTLLHNRTITLKNFERNDNIPIMSTEKSLRYRTRRRSYSYLLNRILRLLNSKLKRSKRSPRKKHG